MQMIGFTVKSVCAVLEVAWSCLGVASDVASTVAAAAAAEQVSDLHAPQLC